MNPVPVIVTTPPPGADAAAGLSPVTVGGPKYRYRSAEPVADVPPGLVTETSTVPVPAGTVAVISVSEVTVYVAARLPNVTAVVPAKPEPVIVTAVPPAVGPLD